MALLERRKLTYDDYLAIPADGRRHELIDGERCVAPAPSTQHQTTVFELILALGTWWKQHGAGRVMVPPYDVVLSDFDVVQPDLLWIAGESLEQITAKHLRGAPDLAVEVVSPSSRRMDEGIKLKLYETYGVAEYWLVDPDAAEVKIWRREGRGFGPPLTLTADADSTLSSPLLPGFSFPVAKLFP